MKHIFGNNPQKTGDIYFEVEIGLKVETPESYMRKIFTAMGLDSQTKIKAFNGYMRKRYGTKDFFQQRVDHIDPRNRADLRNPKGKAIKVQVVVTRQLVQDLKDFGINLLVNHHGSIKFTGYKQAFQTNVKDNLKTEADFIPAKETPVYQWTTLEKLDSVIRRAALLLPEDVGRELLKLTEPWALVFIGVVLGAWVVGHFLGYSAIADGIVLLLGVAALGYSAYQAAEHLYIFAVKCVNGYTEQDLDESAEHLAEAIALVGVQTVMALLLIKAPKVFRKNAGVKLSDIKSLPNSKRPIGEWFYKPRLEEVSSFPNPGTLGKTTIYGDIEYLARLTGKIKDETILHERIHKLLTPKFYPFRNLRLTLRWNSYLKSTILQYLEEALAETVAQVGINGLKNALVGVKFPIKEGYMSLTEIGMEASGILFGNLTVGGIVYRVYLDIKDNKMSDAPSK